MKLQIDTKEKIQSSGIITEYLKSNGYVTESKPLDVGDLAVINDEGETVAIFERKTCKDMAASINDGRYNEQKIRMLNTDFRWKGYILEGIYPDDGISFPSHGKRRIVAKTTYYSVIAGLTLRDNLHVFQTESTEEMAKLLGQLLKKIPEYLKSDGTHNYQQELIKSVSSVRKENMTADVCYLAQLCQIPGVSHKIATCIKDKYPNMIQLLTSLNSDLDLSEINIGERRLGKILAVRIIEYMKPNAETKIKTKIKVVKK